MYVLYLSLKGMGFGVWAVSTQNQQLRYPVLPEKKEGRSLVGQPSMGYRRAMGGPRDITAKGSDAIGPVTGWTEKLTFAVV